MVRELVLAAILIGSCEKKEPPRGVSMAPMPTTDAGAQTMAMFVSRVYKGQVMLHGRLGADPSNSLVCLDVHNDGPDSFMAHLDFGGKYTTDVRGPPHKSFQMCMQDLVPYGTEVRLIADSVMEGPVSVAVGTTQKLQ